MKHILSLFTLLLCFNLAFSQTAFTHKTTSNNTSTHITRIDNKSCNNNPKAILIVQQTSKSPANPYEVGVWYTNGKWTIFNQNKKALPVGATFNVLVLDPAKVTQSFVHKTSKTNTAGHITTINNRYTNSKQAGQLLITQVYGKYNTSTAGVWYDKGKWKIYNEDRKVMPIGTMFNVFVYNSGANLEGEGNITAVKYLKHKAGNNLRTFKIAGRGTIKSKTTSTNLSNTIPKNYLVFTTQNFAGKYNSNPTSVNLTNDKLGIYNSNKKAMESGVQFNVFAVQPKLTLIKYYPTGVVTAGLLKNVYKPGKFVILPKGTGTTSEPVEEISGAEVSTAIQGPDMKIGGRIFLNNVFSDEAFALFLDKLNIGNEVYWDVNKNSNTIYYLPSKYNLNWSKETGEYGFSTFYLSAADDNYGQVLVTAELTPSVSSEDIELARQMLSTQFGNPVNLVPMILSDDPKVEFGNELLSLDVDVSSMSITVPDDFLDPINVTWRMGSRIDDLVALMKEQFGITGKIEFKTYSDDEKIERSDIVLKLNHEDTYGVFEYLSGAGVVNGISNVTDYPITISDMVVMRERTNKTLYAERIITNEHEIQPGEYFGEWSASERDKILEGDLIKKIWVDYEMDKNCMSCNDAVDDKILSGTTAPRSHSIEITVINPIEYTGAHTMKLKLKSIQADPKGNSSVIKTFNISEDFADLNGGDLFYTDDESPDFEYKLIIVEPDGNVKESEWQHHTDLFLVIGSSQIDRMFSE